MLSKIHPPTLIAEGTITQGALVFSSEAQVFGNVEGEVSLETTESLQIGRTGWVQGNINAVGPVFVDGRVIGNILSKSKIAVSSQGMVQGNLTAPRIEILAGARIEGEILTTSSVPSRAPITRAA